MNLVDELHAVAAALEAANVAYALCGGVAVTAHGATRSTKDIDLLIAPTDLPRALDAVRPLGYVFASLPMTFDKGSAKERTINRVSKLVTDEPLMLDFIIADGPFSGLLDDRVTVNLPEGTLRIVSMDTLIKMKRLAGRDQDLADLERLGVGDASHGPDHGK